MGNIFAKLKLGLLKYCSCHSTCCQDEMEVDIVNTRKQKDKDTEVECCCLYYHNTENVHDK